MNKIDKILLQIDKLPPMPQVIQRLAALLHDPDISALKLLETVQMDQALTANVLRIANSAYFGSRRKVTSLNQALTLLGNNRLMNIVVAQGSSAHFSQSNEGYNLAKGELWRHSIGTALGSQILVQRRGGRNDPMLYTAALLHDIGKVVLSEFVAKDFDQIAALVRERGYSFEEAENEVVGIDHAELGARVCEGWNFPPELVAAIRHHHHPEREEMDTLGAFVCVSDLMCMLMGIGAGADGLAYRASNTLLEKLGLSAQDLELAMVELAEEMQRADELLNI